MGIATPKSQTGYMVYVRETLISWSSRKQATVAQSSTELEYWVIAASVQELEWVSSVMSELGEDTSSPLALRSDNQGAVFQALNPTSHSKLKHVAINLHFIRGHVEDGSLILSHIRGSSLRTDTLTKALRPKTFIDMRSNLVGEYPRARGGLLEQQPLSWSSCSSNIRLRINRSTCNSITTISYLYKYT